MYEIRRPCFPGPRARPIGAALPSVSEVLPLSLGWASLDPSQLSNLGIAKVSPHFGEAT